MNVPYIKNKKHSGALMRHANPPYIKKELSTTSIRTTQGHIQPKNPPINMNYQ